MTELAHYIEGLELPTPTGALTREAPATFNSSRQAMVIGSQMTEFADQVPQSMRPAISHGLLLGQLAAEKATSGSDDPWTWFRTYNSVMGKIGWLPTAGEINEQAISDRNASLHKAIIPILTAVFGPAAMGSILLEALKGLEEMDQNSPWITLFEKKSRSVKAAKFGMSYVDAADGEGAALTTVFFAIQAKQVIRQILFLKLSQADATVKTAKSSMMLSAPLIAETQNALKKKVGPFFAENIKNIEI